MKERKEKIFREREADKERKEWDRKVWFGLYI